MVYINSSSIDSVQIMMQVWTSVCSCSLQCLSWWCMWSLCDSLLAYNQIFIHVKNHISMEGSMMREVKCKISITGLVLLNQSSFFFNLGDFHSNTFDMVIKKESVQISKSRVAESQVPWGTRCCDGHIATIEMIIYSVILQWMLFNLIHRLTLPKIKSLWGIHFISPSSHNTHPVHTDSWAKKNCTNGLAFAWSRNNPDCFPQLFFKMLYRMFIPFHMNIKGFIGQGWSYWHIL